MAKSNNPSSKPQLPGGSKAYKTALVTPVGAAKTTHVGGKGKVASVSYRSNTAQSKGRPI